MSTPDNNEANSPLAGLHEHATIGKGSITANTSQRTAHPLLQTVPRRESRRIKPREEVDTDYAEEAEDFFYGEGM